MDNKDYRVDVHYEDTNKVHYGDVALGTAVGILIIPAIYGIYSKIKKINADVKARKAKELEEENK